MRQLQILSLLAPLLLAAQCGVPPEPVEPEPKPPDGGANCSTACDRMIALGCPAGKLTPDGASCLDVCSSVEAEGTIGIDTACITRASSCAEADEC